MENQSVDKDLEEWEKKQAARTQKALGNLTAARKARAAKNKAQNQANCAKARSVVQEKVAARKVVEEKVMLNQPITEEERELLNYKGGRVKKELQGKFMMAAAAKLMIKPSSVSELRLLVETTAAKHSYNPIESLITMCKGNSIPDKEKIAIHRALLPFLVPQLASPKPVHDGQDAGVKVTVTQFVFPNKIPTQQIHEEKAVMVETTPFVPEPEHRSDTLKELNRTPL